MEYYYGIAFLLLAFLQDHAEGFVVSISCSVVAFFSELLLLSLISQGFNIFMSTALLDVMLIFISLTVVDFKLGKILLVTCVLSFFINIFYLTAYTPDTKQFYNMIKPYYHSLNIIIFEILLYSCLINSKARIWGQKILTKFGYYKLKARYESKCHIEEK